jgi:FkbM family methyltransferase
VILDAIEIGERRDPIANGNIGRLLWMLRCIGHQHWIVRGRDRFIRMFSTPDTSAPVEFEVPFFGARYRGRLNSFIDWSVFFYGAWARNELLLLSDVIQALRASGLTKINAYDVGANVGNHTLFLATRCDRVIAFEPYEPVRVQALRKLELNKIRNTVIYPVGLADMASELRFFESGEVSQGEGTFAPPPDQAEASPLVLPVRRGDDFLNSENLPQMHVLKLDVEGFEAQVLAGLRNRLSSDRPVVLMELSATTRANVADADGLRKLFPSRYIFVEIGAHSISGPYLVSKFDFGTTRELLAFPSEAKASICRYIAGLGDVC